MVKGVGRRFLICDEGWAMGAKLTSELFFKKIPAPIFHSFADLYAL